MRLKELIHLNARRMSVGLRMTYRTFNHSTIRFIFFPEQKFG